MAQLTTIRHLVVQKRCFRPPHGESGPLIHLIRRSTATAASPRGVTGDLSAPSRTVLLVAAATVVLAACASPAPTERFEPSGAPSSDGASSEGSGSEGSLRGLTYWSEGDETLKLDACPAQGVPADVGAPAVVIVHGGGFTSGDRSEPGVRALCDAVARSGAAAFAISYRLAPEHVYPDQLDDLARAVGWLRQPEQVQRFSLDPARVGVIGSSAGAILAQQLATRGDGPIDAGSRVAAVVSLSGVSQMGPRSARLGRPSPAAAGVVLGYLGCDDVASCPQGEEASPIAAVDPSDPPMLLVNGSDELVPAEQAETMAAALQRAGVDHEVVIVPGSRHGLALLDEAVRRDVVTFMKENL